MSKDLGLIKKYFITKADGTEFPEDFDAFVLRLDEGQSDKIHLEACRKAVLTYAEEIKDHLPLLSQDLKTKYGR